MSRMNIFSLVFYFLNFFLCYSVFIVIFLCMETFMGLVNDFPNENVTEVLCLQP